MAVIDCAPPDPALVERFRGDLQAITGIAPGPGRRLGLAVSGGADSLALLLLAANAYPGAVVAATVDHGLRAEARAEAAMVQLSCDRLDVRHFILDLPPHWSFKGNLQERARLARYAALKLWARDGHANWVAVAHQRDDVAEAFLMRARRGAGVGGLAEMVRTRPIDGDHGSPALVRPLLGWSRAELARIVAAAEIAPVEDPSNGHPRFDRSRMRRLLAATSELPSARLALAARNLRHAEDAIEWMVRTDLETRLRADGSSSLRLDAAGLPYELRRRFVRHAVERTRRENGLVEDWHATGLDRLLAQLDGGRGGTLAGVKAQAGPHGWRFTPAPPRRTL